MADRREAIELTAEPSPRSASGWGSTATPAIALPAALASAEHRAEFVGELRERLDSDLERGFTDHGPHRDDLAITREGRSLRTYGSQGQQRLGLLALLLAERQRDQPRSGRRCR